MSKRIFVENLDEAVDGPELAKLFADYGVVEHTEIAVEKDTGEKQGAAFVTMRNARQARAAIQGLDGKEHRGRPLSLKGIRRQQEAHSRGGGGWTGPVGGGGRQGHQGGGGGRGGSGYGKKGLGKGGARNR